MRKYLIIETFFDGNTQNFYYLMLPLHMEAGFYRQVTSYNAFFNSTRQPRPNVTKDRQFTCNDEEEIKWKKDFFKDVDWDNLKTFKDIWEFYKFIGYDYKTRKYLKT